MFKKIYQAYLLTIIVCISLLFITPIYAADPTKEEIDNLIKTYTDFKSNYENSSCTDFGKDFFNQYEVPNDDEDSKKELDRCQNYFNYKIKELRDDKVPTNVAFINFLQEHCAFLERKYYYKLFNYAKMLENYLNHTDKHKLFEYTPVNAGTADYKRALKNAEVIGSAYTSLYLFESKNPYNPKVGKEIMEEIKPQFNAEPIKNALNNLWEDYVNPVANLLNCLHNKDLKEATLILQNPVFKEVYSRNGWTNYLLRNRKWISISTILDFESATPYDIATKTISNFNKSPSAYRSSFHYNNYNDNLSDKAEISLHNSLRASLYNSIFLPVFALVKKIEFYDDDTLEYCGGIISAFIKEQAEEKKYAELNPDKNRNNKDSRLKIVIFTGKELTKFYRVCRELNTTLPNSNIPAISLISELGILQEFSIKEEEANDLYEIFIDTAECGDDYELIINMNDHKANQAEFFIKSLKKSLEKSPSYDSFKNKIRFKDRFGLPSEGVLLADCK